jgi:cytochrome c-type biogenesis protein CcmF
MAYNLPGDLFLLLALVFSVISGVSYFLVARGKDSYEKLALKSYNYFTFFTILAFAYLYFLFFSHNYAIKYVHDYSDNSLSFFYTLSAFWGGQEGTYLLWLFLSALFGYVIIRRGGQYRPWAMTVYTTVNLFFLFIMTRLSPFAMLDFVPADGAGLNPLLVDPWMVIHPPVIFVGYAAVAIPFALALAALILNDYSDWVKKAFPWAALTALMLAAGNILGAYWAYKTLGWGGYWAWDPVENSSFIPWFVVLALLHGMVLERRSGALRKSSLLMAAFAFILVIYGTFLTRSGVLADFSVHSFVDLGTNIYLVGFLAFYVLLTLAVFLPRVRSATGTPLNYNYYSKEFSLFAGMILLFLFSVIVLFWTSLPFTTSVFTSEPRAADLATYNSFALPLAVFYAVFLTAAPFLNYNSYTPRNWMTRLLAILAVALVVGFGLFYFVFDASLVFAVVFALAVTAVAMYLLKSDLTKKLVWPLATFIIVVIVSVLFGVRNYLYILYFGAAGMLIVSNVIILVGFLPSRWKLAGGQLTHFGFGLMLIGILGSSAFPTFQRLVISRGDTVEAYGMEIAYQGMEHEITFPRNRLLLTYKDASGEHDARPELYFSERMNGIFRKPYIKRSWLSDLYFSPEQVEELDTGEGLVLAKGETRSLGEYEFTFEGYEMGNHGESQSGLSVVANVTVAHNGTTEQISPTLLMQEDETGKQRPVDLPAKFGETDTFTVSISKILADRGAVVLDIPGLTESGPSDRLILTLSEKPIINLVWIGTTLILLGSLVAVIRRLSEARVC